MRARRALPGAGISDHPSKYGLRERRSCLVPRRWTSVNVWALTDSGEWEIPAKWSTLLLSVAGPPPYFSGFYDSNGTAHIAMVHRKL